MRQLETHIAALFIGVAALLPATGNSELYYRWVQTEDRIDRPLGDLIGNAERGRALAADGRKGNCLACHTLPIPEQAFHGTVGPPLDGVGARLSTAQIRLRVVDQQRLNPNTVMPPFYRPFAQLHQVAWEFENKTFLTAQEVEDIVAYLSTLKGATKP